MVGRVGVIYVAYGAHAVAEAEESIKSLRRVHKWPVVAVGDPVRGAERVQWPNVGRPGRWAKVNLWQLSPFDLTLFLDADTRVRGRLQIGFDALRAGFDFAAVPSKWQERACHHLYENERAATLAELGNDKPLMINSGVIWFAKNERTRALWEAWAEEWQRFKQHDQGALLRALNRAPVRLWLMSRSFNGGGVVEHLFGRARR